MFAETNNLLDDLYPDYTIPGTDTVMLRHYTGWKRNKRISLIRYLG
jgi:hypothetical protein